MKRLVTATARRTVRRALTWRPKAAGEHALDISALISPLRYDVQVRADLFTFFAGAEPALLSDTDRLVAAVSSRPYAVWFEKVAMARFRPWVLADADLLRAQFRERVLSSLSLWGSFTKRGYDLRHPVTLRTTAGPLPTDSGLVIDRRLHVGDGGHRLALLLAAGQPLAPGLYRVDPRPLSVLVDNTAVLVPALGLDRHECAQFVARGYDVGTANAATAASVLPNGVASDAEQSTVLDFYSGLVRGMA